MSVLGQSSADLVKEIKLSAFLRAGKPNRCKGNSVTCYLEQESCFLLINQTKC